MSRKKKTVDEKELMEILSSIARGESVGSDVVKVSERLKAAEMLAKKYTSFDKGEENNGEIRLVVDYVG